MFTDAQSIFQFLRLGGWPYLYMWLRLKISSLICLPD